MMRNLFDLIIRSAAQTPTAEAVIDGNRRINYARLRDDTLTLAGALASLDVVRGDRVAIFLDKRIETVLTIFATAAVSAIFVPINPLLKPEQVAHILSDSGARCLVTTRMRAILLAASGQAFEPLEHLLIVDAACSDDEPLPWLGTASSRSLEQPATRPAQEWQPSMMDTIDSDLAAILYTSGSTGLPKGVMLTHHNLLEGAWSVASYLGNSAGDRILAALPLSFDAGLSQLTTAFHVGACAVLVNYLSATDIIELCGRERITGLTAVPPLWIQLSRAGWPPEARRHLRYFANTGGRMPRPVLDQLCRLFPQARPYLMYGLTEAFRSTYLEPAEAQNRPDSIGKAVPNARILVVRPDGSPCAAEETGELVHVGAFVTKGYWKDPERTALRYRPSPEARSWQGLEPQTAVWSGDLVRRDSAGYLYFVGRTDGQIKTSGYRVSPEEIEEVVLSSGLVGEVVAVGVSDDDLGQVIALVASPSNGGPIDLPALQAFCRERLPSYMVPRYIHVLAEVPRNPNGKFDRSSLQRELANGPKGC